MTRIIGLAGKKGSGKDLSAKIIKGYTSTAYTTEDEFGRTATDLKGRPILEYRSSWEVRKFAAKLRQIASILTGVPVDLWDDRGFKESLMDAKWATRKLSGLSHITAREFLQRLGTDGIRNHLHPEVWVNALFADYAPESHWIITDVRFRNEVDAIKARGGLVIYIDRNTGSQDSHASETEMDSFRDLCDADLPNNGTIQDLTYLLRSFLVQHNIIPS